MKVVAGNVDNEIVDKSSEITRIRRFDSVKNVDPMFIVDTTGVNATNIRKNTFYFDFVRIFENYLNTLYTL